MHMFAVRGSVESSVIYYYLYENWDSVLEGQVDKRASKVYGLFGAGWQAY